MNREHLDLLSSEWWGERVEKDLLPWVLEGVELGGAVLEIGPGPGLTTDVLRQSAPRMTAIEVDPDLAAALAERLGATDVEVVHGDATAMPFEDGRFSSALSFTMLHHVPSPELQDRLFAEVARVLAPGGVFAGRDSTASKTLQALHDGDIYVPIPPETLADRLRIAGFAEVAVDFSPETGSVRFRATTLREAPRCGQQPRF